jgi:CRP-like cAMP-binding protein
MKDELTYELLRENIKAIPFFLKFSELVIRRLNTIMIELKFGPDDLIYKKGDHDSSLYLILDGSIELYHQTPKGIKNVITSLNGRQAFGTLNFITG